jgi:bacteriorhodopsin
MNHKQILLTTVYISLFIQILTGGLDIYALTLSYPPERLLLKSLLWLETIVQVIEATFYVWLVNQFRLINLDNITSKRYFDWFITTPTMLFTLCIYLDYLRNLNKEKITNYVSDIHDKSGKSKKSSNSLKLLYESFQNNKETIIPIVILNAIMLLFGYLGEVKLMNNYLAVFLGFLPFFAMFYIIYENYAKFTSNGETLFWYFSVVWSLYGLAAIMPYFWKNISYNILDIFAKNFFGIFLAYIAIKHNGKHKI